MQIQILLFDLKPPANKWLKRQYS